MLFERTALSRKPEETIRHDLEKLRHEGELTPELLLKDPYVLDFLGLNDRYLEKDLEEERKRIGHDGLAIVKSFFYEHIANTPVLLDQVVRSCHGT